MKSKRRKIFYVALSILIAATIWFYVNNKESVTVYVHDVPIEFLNEDTSLADKGLMRISGDEDITVDLKLQMPRNVVYDFDTSELRLVSDLSTITYAGKQSVSYTILYPSKVSSSSVKVESPTIRTVQVEIGELNKKDIEIRCKVVGNVAEGYIAGTVGCCPKRSRCAASRLTSCRSATRRSRSTSKMHPPRSWSCSTMSSMTSTTSSLRARTSIP